MCVPAQGYFYLLSLQLRSPLARAVALFMLHLLHSTKFFSVNWMGELALDSFQFAGKLDCSTNYDDS